MPENSLWSPAYDAKAVKILEEQPVFSGKYVQFINFKLKFKTFAGTWSKEVNRFVLNKLHAAALLLYNPEEDYVLLLEQFRIGAFFADKNPWLLEPVAGLIENKESPETTAIREAKEESGSEVLDILPICSYLASPGTTNEETFLYCGRINSCNLGIYGLEHEAEDIKVHKIPTKIAFKMLNEGKLICAQTIIALQWLQIHYHQLQSKWNNI